MFKLLKKATIDIGGNFLKDFSYTEKIILKKVSITKVIYKLIQSICKDNDINQ